MLYCVLKFVRMTCDVAFEVNKLKHIMNIATHIELKLRIQEKENNKHRSTELFYGRNYTQERVQMVRLCRTKNSIRTRVSFDHWRARPMEPLGGESLNPRKDLEIKNLKSGCKSSFPMPYSLFRSSMANFITHEKYNPFCVRNDVKIYYYAFRLQW